MGLNRAGIQQLVDDLRASCASTELLYDQGTFGSIRTNRDAECRTECCMAGLCLIKEIGLSDYQTLVLQHHIDSESVFVVSALSAGRRQLGIDPQVLAPQIFEGVIFWPHDLRRVMCLATAWPGNYERRVEVAIAALRRLHADGSIDKDPNYDNGMVDAKVEEPEAAEYELVLA